MKGRLAAIPFVLALACGGSNNNSGSSGGNPNNFLGSTWNGSVNTTVSCPGQPPQSALTTYTVAFSQSSDADLQYTSSAGCTFKFRLPGNTASLSNAPVSCTATSGGLTVNVVVTTYTLTTSDGHNLSISASGSTTDTSSQTSCPFSQSGTATR